MGSAGTDGTDGRGREGDLTACEDEGARKLMATQQAKRDSRKCWK
jgi:hypothetical protein